jgi:hypothetical protein
VNIVRFNDPFEQGVVAKVGRQAWARIATAPLFDYRLDVEHAKEKLSFLVEQLQDEDKQLFPFPFIRAEIKTAGGLGVTDDARLQVICCEDPALIFARCPTWLVWDKEHNRDRIMRAPHHKPPPLVCLVLIDNRGGYNPEVFRPDRNGWELWPDDLLQREREDRDFYRMTMADTLTLMADCMLPGNHVVAVHPAQEHRSVEWIKARTHYTLITHGHPANRPTVGHGTRVQNDAQGELTRMAHNRRAHYRTLRHQRYRFARGQRVLVRAAWVGPKEWKDEGGKQIYKILEPVADEA